MKHSPKLPEPAFLTSWKAKVAGKNGGGVVAYSRFKSKPEKKQLHKFILEEQSGLCCYCGSRVTYDSVNQTDNDCHIEHFDPDRGRDLEYGNLFVSCGLSDTGFRPMTCGSSKANNLIDVALIPSANFCETQFSYGINGGVYGKSQSAIEAANTLSLNDPSLVSARASILKEIEVLVGVDEINDDNIGDFLNDLSVKDSEGNEVVFIQVIRSYLKEEFSIA